MKLVVAVFLLVIISITVHGQVKAILTRETYIYPISNTTKSPIGKFLKGDSVVLENKGSFIESMVYASNSRGSGYINMKRLHPTEEVRQYIELVRTTESDKRFAVYDSMRIARRLAEERGTIDAIEKRNALIQAKFSKYGGVIVKDITDRKVWIGMTTDMAVNSWGEPDRKNKSVRSWGTQEQWVYHNAYLYFKDGKLDSYHISE